MTHVVHGRINGKTIELDSELAVPDGQQVEVFVRAVEPYKGWGEGIGVPRERPLTSTILTRCLRKSNASGKRQRFGRPTNELFVGHQHLRNAHSADV